MNVKIKNPIFRIYDVLLFPLTFIAVIHIRILRRYGIPNFPLAHRFFFKIGVFPIIRHFYEPLFHPDDLTQSLKDIRELPGIDFRAEEQLLLLDSFHYNDEIARYFCGDGPAQADGLDFNVNNNAFRHGDVELYYNIIRHFKPSRIIEIGSGHSTKVALRAALENEHDDPNLRCEVTAIEPYPWFRHEKLNLISQRVEDVDLALFKGLVENDILFIDSSHMIRPQGDVLFEVLRVLPSLAPGVIVHIHDVFTPRDYLESWVKVEHKFWNEQYLLEAFLSCNDQFKVLLAPNYLQAYHEKELLSSCPLLAKAPESSIHSFWIQRCAAKVNGG